MEKMHHVLDFKYEARNARHETNPNDQYLNRWGKSMLDREV